MVLLIDKQSHDDFRYRVDGLSVAVQVFRDALKGSRERDILKWARVILYHAGRSDGEYTHEVFLDIFNYALECRDLKLWMEVTRSTKWSFGRINTGFIFKAYKTFSFEDLRERSVDMLTLCGFSFGNIAYDGCCTAGSTTWWIVQYTLRVHHCH